MRARVEELPRSQVERLKELVRVKGAEPGLLVVRPSQVWLLVMGGGTLAIGLLAARTLIEGGTRWERPLDAVLPWVGLLGLLYGPIAVVERLRAAAAELPAFLLLTPFNLIVSRGSHRPLLIHRLREARSFEAAEEHHRTTWTGRSYRFAFDDGSEASFTLRRPEDLEAATRMLTLAQSVGRGEPLAGSPWRQEDEFGHAAPAKGDSAGWVEKVLDPASETWLQVLGLLCLAALPFAFLR